MTAVWEFMLGPFIEFGFMRRALAATVALSLAAGPLGVFLIVRRLSLMGDALSHAILPGVAVGYLIAGLSLPAMLVGGGVTGVLVALFSGWVARIAPIREDTSFATFYLMSLGLGVLLVSLRGSNMDLLHVLFGSVLGLDNAALLLVSGVSSLSLLVFAVIYRPLVMDSIDPYFKRAHARVSLLAHMSFLFMLVLTLVAGFQILGTLMVVGLMILPAAAARFLGQGSAAQLLIAAVLAIVASYLGLLASFHYDVPTSPAIILIAGVFYLIALFVGPYGGVWHRFRGQQRTVVGVIGGLGGTLLISTLSMGEVLAEALPHQSTAAPAMALTAPHQERPVRVVASFAVLADMIEQIGGETVEVHTIVGPDRSAHHFEPRARDMQELMAADLLVINGAGLEPWASALVQAAGYTGPMVQSSSGLPLREDDPHAWLRVDYAQHYAAQIYAALRSLLPESLHPHLEARYQAYEAELAALHQQLQEDFGPESGACGVGVVLAHDSMFYFEQAYGCPHFIPLEAASLEAEVSARSMAQLIRSLRTQNIRAAVPEFGVDARLIEQVARETQIPLGQPLYTETFAPEGDPVDSYLSLMRWNQQVLKEVLHQEAAYPMSDSVEP